MPLPHLAHVAQPTDGGVVVAVAALAAHQHRAGHSVTVLCPGASELGDRCRDEGIATIRWDATRDPGPNTVDEVRRLGALLGDAAPDVVHLHSSKAGLAGRLALRGRPPTVFQPHGWSFLPPGPQQPVARWWERAAARWTHLTVTVGDDERAAALTAGIPGVLAVVPNGVDVDALPVADDSTRRTARAQLGLGDGPVAVCVGRLCTQKGQDLLLDAWPLVLATVPDATLLLVGDGPAAPALAQRAATSVVLTGAVATVVPHLAATDVVVAPSRWEGLSLAVLEALAVGRPVVAFDVEGMRQAIGDAGAVVPPGRVDLLARQVVDRLTDPALAAREGAAGAARTRAQFDRAVQSAAVTRATVNLLGRSSR